MINKSWQVRAYIAGKESEKFKYGDKFYHRTKNLWKWKMEGATELLGFKDKEEINLFIKKYL